MTEQNEPGQSLEEALRLLIRSLDIGATPGVGGDLTAQEFQLRLDRTFASYCMYKSQEEVTRGSAVVNGVYINKSYLPVPPPRTLRVKFDWSQ